MNRFSYTRFLLLIFCCIALDNSLYAEDISLKEAIAKHLLYADFVSRGGHTGDCVDMTLRNLSKDQLTIHIDAGDKLMCSDSTMQNIFITHSDTLELAPAATLKKTIFGFCCAVTKHSPQKAITFSFRENKDTSELKLAHFLDKHRDINTSVMQQAIWIICNGEDPAGIYGQEDADLKALKKLISEITHTPIPWYTKEYGRDSTGMLIRRVLRIHADMEFDIRQLSEVNVVIFDVYNHALKTPLEARMLERGHYEFDYFWETNRLESGKYFVRIFSNGQIIQEKEILL